MANTDKNLITTAVGKEGREIHAPVKGAHHIYEGSLVAQMLATGLLVAGSTAGSGQAVGVAQHEVDTTNIADSARRCAVQTDRIFEFDNASAGDACSEAMQFFTVVYMVDDHTVANNSAGGTRQAAGRYMGISDNGKVRVYVGMDSLTNVGTGALLLSLNDFREMSSAGDVSNIAANGGLLASDTTPILRGDAAEVQEISWAAGNADIIGAQFALPPDFDGSADATLELWVYTDNAGGGGIDAASFTVETSWDGGALVADTATDAAPAITSHKITATIAAADIPDGASFLTVMLTPAAHANDPTQLQAARLTFRRKP